MAENVKQYQKASYIIKKYGIDRTTLYRWLKKGMPAIQTPGGHWVFDEDAVEKWMSEKEKQ